MVKGVIFDFNGTLFFDTPMHKAAWKQFAKEKFGLHPTDKDIRDQYLGRNNFDILRRLAGPDTPVDVLNTLTEEKEALYRDICRKSPSSFHLTVGAPELFERLKAEKCPAFIASGSEYQNMNFYMTEMGLSKWFTWDRIIYDDHTLPGKPDPAVYLKAAQKIGLPPEELAVFEDSRSGIEAARRAGISRIIAVSDNEKDDFAKSLPGVYTLIHDFTNAYPLLIGC